MRKYKFGSLIHENLNSDKIGFPVNWLSTLDGSMKQEIQLGSA